MAATADASLDSDCSRSPWWEDTLDDAFLFSDNDASPSREGFSTQERWSAAHPENQQQVWNTKQRHWRKHRPQFIQSDKGRGTGLLKQGAASSTVSSRAGTARDEHCITSGKPASVGVRSLCGATSDVAAPEAINPGKQRSLPATARDERCVTSRKPAPVGVHSPGGATPDGAVPEAASLWKQRSLPATARDERCVTSRKPASFGIHSLGGSAPDIATVEAPSPRKHPQQQRSLPATARDLPDIGRDHAGSACEGKASVAPLQQRLCKPATESPDSARVVPVTKIGSSYAELSTYKIPKIKQSSPLKEHGNLVSTSPLVVQDCSRQLLGECDEVPERFKKAASPPRDVSGDIGPSSKCLVDKIMDEMDRAFPRITAGFLACDDAQLVHQAMDTSAIFRSPVRCPLETEYRSRTRLAQLEKMPFKSLSGWKEPVNRICSLCNRRNVCESNSQTCVRCSLCEEIMREQATVKQKTGVPEANTTPLKESLRRISSDVQNKEETGKRLSLQGTLETNAAPPRKKRKKERKARRPHKIYISKKLITSSESEKESDRACVTNSPAVKKVDTVSSPSKICSLTEPTYDNDNSGKDIDCSDMSRSSERPTSLICTAMNKMSAKPNAKRGKLRGSREVYARRKAMKIAWRKAKDTDEYLRVISEIEGKNQTVDTATTCEKVSEPEKVDSDLAYTPNCVAVDATSLEVDIDMSTIMSDVKPQPALVISSCRSLSITDWENQDSQSPDAQKLISNVENENNDGNRLVVPVIMVSNENGLSDEQIECVPESPTDIPETLAGLSPIVIYDSSGECQKASEDGNSEKLKKGRGQEQTTMIMGLPYVVSYEDDGAMSVTIQGASSNQEGLSDEEDCKSTGHIEEAGVTSCVTKNDLDSCAMHLEESTTEPSLVNIEKRIGFSTSPLASPMCEIDVTVDLPIVNGRVTAGNELDTPPATLHLPATQSSERSGKMPCSGELGSSLDHPLTFACDANAYFDVVSLVDDLFKFPGAATSDVHKCSVFCAELHELLEEYVQILERFFETLYSLKLDVRMALVETLLPNGFIVLKKMVLVIWKMEEQLGCLGVERVKNLQRSVFLVLSEYTAHLQRAVETEPDMPSYISFELPDVHPSLRDQPSGKVAAEKVKAQDGNSGSEHQDRSSPMNATSDAASLERREALAAPAESSAVDMLIDMVEDVPAVHQIGRTTTEEGQNSEYSNNTARTKEKTVNIVQELGSRSPENKGNCAAGALQLPTGVTEAGGAAGALQLPTGVTQAGDANACKDILTSVAEVAVNHRKADFEQQVQCSPVSSVPGTVSHLMKTEIPAPPAASIAVDTPPKSTESTAASPLFGCSTAEEQQTNSGSGCTAGTSEVVVNSAPEPRAGAQQSPACAKLAESVCAHGDISPDIAAIAAGHPERNEGPHTTACGVAALNQGAPLERPYMHSSGGFAFLPQCQAKPVDLAISTRQQPLHSSQPSKEHGTGLGKGTAEDGHIGQLNNEASKETIVQVQIANGVPKANVLPCQNSPSDRPGQQKPTTAATAQFIVHQGRQVRFEVRQPPALICVAPPPYQLAQREPAASTSGMSSTQVQRYNNQLAAYTRRHNSLTQVPPNEEPLSYATHFLGRNIQQVPSNNAQQPELLAQNTKSSDSFEQCRGSTKAFMEVQAPPPYRGSTGPALGQIPPFYHNVSRMLPETLGVEARQQFQQAEPYLQQEQQQQQQQAMRGQHVTSCLSPSAHPLHLFPTAPTSQATTRNTEQIVMPRHSSAPSEGAGATVGRTRDAELHQAEQELQKKIKTLRYLEMLRLRTECSQQYPSGQRMGPAELSTVALEKQKIIQRQIQCALLSIYSNCGARSAQKRQVHESYQQSQQYQPLEHQYMRQYSMPTPVRPWEERPLQQQMRWPYPYNGCQEALAKFKEQQYFDSVKARMANVPGNVASASAAPSLSNYQAVPLVPPRQTYGQLYGQQQPPCQASSATGPNPPARSDASQTKGEEVGTVQPSVPYQHEHVAKGPRSHPSSGDQRNAGPSGQLIHLQSAGGELQSGQQLFRWPQHQ